MSYDINPKHDIDDILMLLIQRNWWCASPLVPKTPVYKGKAGAGGPSLTKNRFRKKHTCCLVACDSLWVAMLLEACSTPTVLFLQPTVLFMFQSELLGHSRFGMFWTGGRAMCPASHQTRFGEKSGNVVNTTWAQCEQLDKQFCWMNSSSSHPWYPNIEDPKHRNPFQSMS